MCKPDYGARLWWLRHRTGYSQDKLARRAGVSLALVSRIESGQRTLTRDAADKLAPALGVTVEELMDRPISVTI